MSPKNSLITVAAVATLAGCAAGTPFKWEDTAKIHNGMTEDEVVGILGKPYSRSQTGNVLVETWSTASAFGGARAVSYRFVDDKVVSTTTMGQ